MQGKDFLTLTELSPEDLSYVLDLSERLKRFREQALGADSLSRKSVALIFEKPSTRTRVSFQVAINELGGSPIALSAAELQLGRGETIEDTAHVLSRYIHCMMARVNSHGDLERLAAAASVPVINGLSDLHHPVQILADLLTLREHRGPLKGLRVAWVGDGDNVCNSWMFGAALTGIHFTAATPPRYAPPASFVRKAQRLARATGGSINLVSEPEAAARGADCVITDTFVSMGLEQERSERIRTFLPKYQVSEKLLSLASRNAIFMHCLPAHRGEEVAAGVIDGPRSVIFDEAENRLHTTKALLCFLLLSRRNLAKLSQATAVRSRR
jgi:ornithine carbamoyltransferase